MKKLYIYTFLLLCVSFAAPRFASAQLNTTKGTDFWLGYMLNFNADYNNFRDERLSVVVSAQAQAARVTISVPGGGFTRTINVPANSSEEVRLPVLQVLNTDSDAIERTAVRVVSDVDVNVYGMNYKQNSADATVVLPSHVLRDDYVVLSYGENTGQNGLSEFVVVATEDDTRVQITPTGAIINGANAGQTFTINLDAGEVYQAIGQSFADLAGTRIRSAANSECKPFAVFAGANCTNVGDCGRCDHLFEQMFPVNSLGQYYVTIPLESRRAYQIRVMATEDATEVTFSTGGTVQLDAGEFLDTESNVPVIITGDKPIMVAQLAQGGCCDENATPQECAERDNWYGDPFLLLISPVEQMTIKNATVNALEIDNIDNSYINIITRTANTGLMRLNGNNIQNRFGPVPGNPGLSFAQVAVPQAIHNIASDSGFIAYVYGFGERDSYGYSGDVMLNNIAVQIEGPERVCAGAPVAFTGESNREVSRWEWFRDDVSVARGERADITFDEPGTYELKLQVESRQSTCALDSSFKEIQVFRPELAVEQSFSYDCEGRPRGFLRFAMAEGLEPYEYSVNGGRFTTESAFRVTGPGDYEIRARDAAGCETQTTITVEEREPFFAELLSKTDASCGRDNGSISLTVSNGTPPYRFQWSHGPTVQDPAGLGADDYSVTVTDAEECRDEVGPVTIFSEEAPDAEIAVEGRTNICSNESVLLSVPPGDGLTFQWFRNGEPIRGATDNEYRATEAGSYTVRVSQEDCESETETPVEITVRQAPEVSIESSGPSRICEGQSIELRGTVSPENAALQWFRGDELIRGETRITYLASTSGEYFLQATINECPVRSNGISLEVLPLPEAQFTVNPEGPICDGEAVTLTARRVNLATYVWRRDGVQLTEDDNTNPVLQANQGGTYALTVRLQYPGGGSPCENTSETVTIEAAPTPSAEVEVTGADGLVCQGAEIVLRAARPEAGVQYQWRSGGAIVANGPEYAFTAEDCDAYQLVADNGICSAESDRVEICPEEIPEPVIETDGELSFCAGESLLLESGVEPRDDLSFQWFRDGAPLPGAVEPNYEATEGGVYTAQVQREVTTPDGQAGVCIRTSEAVVLEVNEAPPARILPQSSLVFCEGTSVVLQSRSADAENYRWLRDGEEIDGENGPALLAFETGFYVLETRAGECVNRSRPTPVISLDRPEITSWRITDSRCGNLASGGVDITVEGGSAPYKFYWNNGARSEDLVNVPAGDYRLFVDDANNCRHESIAFTVNAPSAIEITVDSTRDLLCSSVENGGIFVSVSGGEQPYNYYWTDGSRQQDLRNVAAGRYSLLVFDATGCIEVLRNVEVSAEAALRGFVSQVVEPGCHGDSSGGVFVTATGGLPPYEYRFPYESDTFTTRTFFPNIPAGEYDITVRDARGCRVAFEANVTQPDSVTVNYFKRDVTCPATNNGSILVFPEGGTEPYTYRLRNLPNVHGRYNWLSPGRYVVRVIDGNGCVFESDTVRVGVDQSGAMDVRLRPAGVAQVNEDSTCSQLTASREDQAGAVWNEVPLDLNSGFDLRATVNFGDANEAGGDGVAFVMQSEGPGALGEDGAGLGFSGIANSFGVEFDTHDNEFPAEIDCDHIAFVGAGDLLNPLEEPVSASSSGCNVEDGGNHQVRITWSPATRELVVFFDGVERARREVDLVGEYFGGNPSVFFGFTGATGGRVNRQRVCVNSMAVSCECLPFTFDLDPPGVHELCKGETVTFRAPAGYAGYLWNTGETTSSITVSEPGEYYVDVSDGSGCGGNSSVSRVIVYPKPEITYEKKDLTFADGYDGWIDAEAASGTPPYTFTLFNTLGDEFVQDGGQYFGLEADVYQLQVEDVNECRDLVTIPVNEPNTLCKKPRNLQVFKITETSAEVEWEIPEEGEKDPTGYIVEYRRDFADDEPWLAGQIDDPFNPRASLRNLIPGGAYLVRVRTVCGESKSLFTPDSVFTTPIGCARPVDMALTLTVDGPNVSWSEMLNARRYIFEWKPLASNGPWQSAITEDTYYELRDVDPFTEYMTRVRTVCSDGAESVPGDTLGFNLADIPPCSPPFNVREVSVTKTTVTLEWDPVFDVDFYEVQFRPQSGGDYLSVETDTSRIVLEGLRGETSYEFRVVTHCVFGNESEPSATGFFTTLATDCPTPVNAVVTPGKFTADVRWDGEATVERYQLSWRKENDFMTPWVNINVEAEEGPLEYRIRNIDSCTVYDFRIRGLCAVDPSFWARQTFQTLPNCDELCAPPNNIRVVSSSLDSVVITWEPALNAEEYRLHYRLGPNGAWTERFTSAPRIKLQNPQDRLLPTGAYQFQVQSLCDNGKNSDFSPMNTFEIDGDCPAPTLLNLAADGPRALTASWQLNPVVEGYRLTWRPIEPDAPGKVYTINSPAINSYRLEDLIPERPYEITLTNICADDRRSETLTRLWRGGAAFCPEPANLTATPVSQVAAQLRWAPVETASRYVVEWRTAGQSWAQGRSDTTDAVSTQAVGLVPGATYFFRVRSLCGDLPSDYSETGSFVSGQACASPTGLVVNQIGATSAVVSWNIATGAGGYELAWRPQGAGQSWTALRFDSPAQNSQTLENLTPATDYEVRVLSRCAGGLSNWTRETFRTENPATSACAMPEIITALDLTATSALLQWSDVPGATEYEVRYRQASQWTERTTTESELQLNGLQRNGLYYYQVRAVCEDGVSPRTAQRTFRTTNECPEPANLLITPNLRSANATWDYAPGATGYFIQWRPEDRSIGFSSKTINEPDITTVELTALEPCKTYEVRLSAQCGDYRTGALEQTFETFCDAGDCSAPPQYLATNITPAAATISIQPVPEAEGYAVRYRETSAGNWTNRSADDASYQLTGLTPGAEYEVAVRADCGDSGFSPWGPVIAFETPEGCPVPEGFDITRTESERALASWDINLGAEGYEVKWRRQSSAVWTEAEIGSRVVNSYWIEGLSPGQSYAARVRTLCADGPSAWSEQISFSTANGRAGRALERASVFSVYPNPNRGRFTAAFDAETSGDVRLRALDLTGRVVLRETRAVVEGPNALALDLSAAGAGVYILELRVGDSWRRAKVVVE